jgi:hypothetical protein
MALANLESWLPAPTTQALYDRFCDQLERTARPAVGEMEKRAQQVAVVHGAYKFGSCRRGSEAAHST